MLSGLIHRRDKLHPFQAVYNIIVGLACMALAFTAMQFVKLPPHSGWAFVLIFCSFFCMSTVAWQGIMSLVFDWRR